MNEVKEKKYYCGTEKKYLSTEEIENHLPLSNLLIFPPLPTSIHSLPFANNIEENIITEETMKEEIPLEILNKIIEFSDGKSLFNLSQVSKEVRQLCLSENEKYKEKYLSSYYPLNNQYLHEFMEALEGEDFLYEDIEAAKALYSTSFNSHSTCDPHFNHLFFWKDLFHLRVHLQPYQANPCDWLYTLEDYDRPAYCDPRLCEFFRISQKTISETNCNINTGEKNNDEDDNEEEEEDEDEEGMEEDFYEVELVAITRTLHPIRLLIRSGIHPSVSKSRKVRDITVEQLSRFPLTTKTDDKNGNKEYYYGREVGKKYSIHYDDKNLKKKKKIEFEGFESEEEDEEDKEICKKLGIILMRDKDVPSCPCTIECNISYDIFIWNYKKQRYEHFFRTFLCARGCVPSNYESRSAQEWEEIFSPLYPKAEKKRKLIEKEDDDEETLREKRSNTINGCVCKVSQLTLAALASCGIPLNEMNYQSDIY